MSKKESLKLPPTVAASPQRQPSEHSTSSFDFVKLEDTLTDAHRGAIAASSEWSPVFPIACSPFVCIDDVVACVFDFCEGKSLLACRAVCSRWLSHPLHSWPLVFAAIRDAREKRPNRITVSLMKRRITKEQKRIRMLREDTSSFGHDTEEEVRGGFEDRCNDASQANLRLPFCTTYEVVETVLARCRLNLGDFDRIPDTWTIQQSLHSAPMIQPIVVIETESYVFHKRSLSTSDPRECAAADSKLSATGDLQQNQETDMVRRCSSMASTASDLNPTTENQLVRGYWKKEKRFQSDPPPWWQVNGSTPGPITGLDTVMLEPGCKWVTEWHPVLVRASNEGQSEFTRERDIEDVELAWSETSDEQRTADKSTPFDPKAPVAATATCGWGAPTDDDGWQYGAGFSAAFELTFKANAYSRYALVRRRKWQRLAEFH